MAAGQKNVAVLDLTHGGIPIAQKLAQLGFNVSAVDVYDTVDEGILADLQNNFNISTSKVPLPVDGFDTIVAPVHLNPGYEMMREAEVSGKEIISHHRMVGEILFLDGRISGSKTIEVTGTKAKTSTSSILADIISRDMSVVLHTSRGLEHWEGGRANVLHKGLSITPGSILLAVDIALSSGLVPDVFIFEVSIGGTGFADMGIITTLDHDYRIAAETSWASDAKLQMIDHSKEGSVLFLNCICEKAVHRAKQMGRKVVTFSDSPDCKGDVNIELGGNDIIISSAEGSVRTGMCGGYDTGSYSTAYAAASAVALELGIEMDCIASALCSFRGLSGRMRQSELEGRTLIDNSNSGMDIKSVETSLEYALGKKMGRILMVLGEEASQVCEGLPPSDVSSFLEKRGGDLDELILVGERMRYLGPASSYYANSLEEGLSFALSMAGFDDIIISCVKCFR